MSSAKRRNDFELTRENQSEADDEGRYAPVQQAERASSSVLAGRKLAKPMRRLQSTQAAPSSNPFSGLGAKPIQPQQDAQQQPQQPQQQDAQQQPQQETQQQQDAQQQQYPTQTTSTPPELTQRSLNQQFAGFIARCLAVDASKDFTEACNLYISQVGSLKRKNEDNDTTMNIGSPSDPSKAKFVNSTTSAPAHLRSENSDAKKFAFVPASNKPASPSFKIKEPEHSQFIAANQSAAPEKQPWEKFQGKFQAGPSKADFSADSKFKFGASNFTFGKKDESPSAQGEKEAPKFKFGAQNEGEAPKFKFGAQNEGEAPKFKFGAPSEKESASAPKFTFGVKEADTKDKPTFTFGAKETDKTEDKPKFTFGAKETDKEEDKPKFAFGAKFSFGNSGFGKFKVGPKTDDSEKPKAEDKEDKAEGEDEENVEEAEPTKDLSGKGKGEEDEDAAFEGRCKVYRLISSNFEVIGLGVGRVLVNRKTNKSRLLVRSSTGGVVLNVALSKLLKYQLQSNTQIKVPEFDETGKPKGTLLVQVRKDSAKELVEVMERVKN